MASAADQQTQFDSAFAQAGAPAKRVDPSAPLPYYPAPRYIAKNQLPETSLTHEDVTAVAKARLRAEKSGVLTPDLGEHLLPMAMVEGRGPNFGIKEENGFYPKPATLDRFKKMGVSITDMTDPATAQKYQYDIQRLNPETGETEYFRKLDPKAVQESYTAGHESGGPILQQVKIPALGNMVIRKDEDGVKRLHPGEAHSSIERAQMMAAILADKNALAGGGTPEKAVKLYNGKGRSMEYDSDTKQYVPADVNVYWAKVQAAKQMLQHQSNAPLVNHYNSTYMKGR